MVETQHAPGSASRASTMSHGVEAALVLRIIVAVMTWQGSETQIALGLVASQHDPSQQGTETYNSY